MLDTQLSKTTHTRHEHQVARRDPVHTTGPELAPLTEYSVSLAASADQLGHLDGALLQFRSAVLGRSAVREPDARSMHEIAQSGIEGSGHRLPHLDRIQQSFGRHDVSRVVAFTGGRAAEAASELGAQAYATSGRVAFATTPDLHTAAHEAAHVVQQKGGVQLQGGVGTDGDAYEQHADAVADAVLAGRSAEALLDTMAGGASGQRAQAVQRQTLTCGAGGRPAKTKMSEKVSLEGDRSISIDSTGKVEGCMKSNGAKVCTAGNLLKGSGATKMEIKEGPLSIAFDVEVAPGNEAGVKVKFKGTGGIGGGAGDFQLKKTLSFEGQTDSAVFDEERNKLLVDCVEIHAIQGAEAEASFLKLSHETEVFPNIALLEGVQIGPGGLEKGKISVDWMKLGELAVTQHFMGDYVRTIGRGIDAADKAWTEGQRRDIPELHEPQLAGRPQRDVAAPTIDPAEIERRREDHQRYQARCASQAQQDVNQPLSGGGCRFTMSLYETVPFDGMSTKSVNRIELLRLHGEHSLDYYSSPNRSRRESAIEALEEATSSLPALSVQSLLDDANARIDAPLRDIELTEEQLAWIAVSSADVAAAHSDQDDAKRRQVDVEEGRYSHPDIDGLVERAENRVRAAEDDHRLAMAHARHEARAADYTRRDLLRALLDQGVTSIDVVPGETLETSAAGYLDGAPRVCGADDSNADGAFSGQP